MLPVSSASGRRAPTPLPPASAASVPETGSAACTASCAAPARETTPTDRADEGPAKCASSAEVGEPGPDGAAAPAPTGVTGDDAVPEAGPRHSVSEALLTAAVGPLPDHPPAALYGRTFWYAYGSNLLFMIAVSLLFRLGDYVTVLGGGERELGWIVGFGMIGSLFARITIGTAIDRRGAREIWLASAVGFAVSCVGHVFIVHIHSPWLYALRLLFCCSIAALFGASMTFIGALAPRHRVAELIGMLGTSGFLGTLLGTQLGDLLLGREQIARSDVNLMFWAAAGLALAAAMLALLATRGGTAPPKHNEHAPPWRVLRSYFPLPVFVAGAAMGAGLVVLQTFLRTYTAKLGIHQIGNVFAVYAITAVVTRVLTRRWPERVGIMRMIVAGLLALALGQLLLWPVSRPWHLIGSGLAFGFGHALLFPSVVAAGTIGFPARHRGLATTSILSAWDVGQLLGAPAGGMVLTYSLYLHLPEYPSLFVATAVMLVAVAFYFVRAYRPRAAGAEADNAG